MWQADLAVVPHSLGFELVYRQSHALERHGWGTEAIQVSRLFSAA